MPPVLHPQGPHLLGRSRVQRYCVAGPRQYRPDGRRGFVFTLDGDEPPVLLGANHGPNAVEAVLHALASCVAVGVAYNAAAQGIEIRSLEFDLEGQLDLHGFLGLSPDIRPGYRDIRVTYRIDSDATAEKVDELCAYAQNTSPVLDIVTNPVPVTITRA
jgi:uncharacterized OsmC-like protein